MGVTDVGTANAAGRWRGGAGRHVRLRRATNMYLRNNVW